mgnify:CR=1 FL=1
MRRGGRRRALVSLLFTPPPRAASGRAAVRVSPRPGVGRAARRGGSRVNANAPALGTGASWGCVHTRGKEPSCSFVERPAPTRRMRRQCTSRPAGRVRAPRPGAHLRRRPVGRGDVDYVFSDWKTLPMLHGSADPSFGFRDRPIRETLCPPRGQGKPDAWHGTARTWQAVGGCTHGGQGSGSVPGARQQGNKVPGPDVTAADILVIGTGIGAADGRGVGSG